MIYFVLFIIAAFLIGFIGGVGVKTFLDNDEIADLEKKNARLHAQLTQAKRVNIDRVEIIDPNVGKSVDFSQRW